MSQQVTIGKNGARVLMVVIYAKQLTDSQNGGFEGVGVTGYSHAEAHWHRQAAQLTVLSNSLWGGCGSWLYSLVARSVTLPFSHPYEYLRSGDLSRS
jgi:hypothetical protein